MAGDAPQITGCWFGPSAPTAPSTNTGNVTISVHVVDEVPISITSKSFNFPFKQWPVPIKILVKPENKNQFEKWEMFKFISEL